VREGRRRFVGRIRRGQGLSGWFINMLKGLKLFFFIIFFIGIVFIIIEIILFLLRW